MNVLLVDIENDHGCAQTIAHTSEDVRGSQARSDAGVKLFMGEAEVPVKDDGRDNFQVDVAGVC